MEKLFTDCIGQKMRLLEVKRVNNTLANKIINFSCYNLSKDTR